MAIREADCENCGEKVYTANGKSWYHFSSRRWHCGEHKVDSLDVHGAVPTPGTEVARKGANA